MLKVEFSALVVAFACSMGAASRAATIEVPMAFDVTIKNDSLVPCLGTGGGPATISGRLITPDPPPPDVTLYVHGLGFGQWFWHFDGVAGYDYARELADLGHASVIVDRLGYGDSSHPDGNSTCLGVQADIAHQIVGQLRSDFGFSKVALAGHSAGGAIAEIEAYSFKDVDALLVFSYADQGPSLDTLVTFAQAGGQCLSSPNHYGDFGQTPQDFDHLMFNTDRVTPPLQLPLDSAPTADPTVITVATPMRERDPCGDYNSFPEEILLSQLLLSQIQVPALLVCGDRDAIFPPPACDLQALHFLSNADFTHATIAGGGHALTLGFTAADFRKAVSDWLGDPRRGF